MRTQEPMFAFVLLAGRAVIGMAGSSALIGYGRLERGCSVRGRGNGRLGGGSGWHGKAWWEEDSQLMRIAGRIIDADMRATKFYNLDTQ